MRDHPLNAISQARVRSSFRRGLNRYHATAVAQAQIADHLAELLARQTGQTLWESVFEFGCGTGHLTEALLRRFEVRQLVLNDLVPEAVGSLRRTMSDRLEQTQFCFGPVEAVPLPSDLDLVASASTVQWIGDIPGLMARLCARLAPGGWLAVSGFGRYQFHELQTLGSQAAAPSYADRADWQDMLPAGMELRVVEQAPLVLEFDTAIDLLRHLRHTGVNGNAQQGWSRRQLQQFELEYRAQFETNGRLPLTYDPVWIVAQKVGS